MAIFNYYVSSPEGTNWIWSKNFLKVVVFFVDFDMFLVFPCLEENYKLGVPKDQNIQKTYTGVGKCPMTWEYKGHHLIVAIIDHIPNGWVMFNGDI